MAMVGLGATVSGPGFTGELVSVDVSGLSANAVDVTHQGSTDGYREFLAGAKDPGEVETEVLMNGAGPLPGQKGTLTITFPVPDGGTSGPSFSCEAILTEVSVGCPLDDRVTMTLRWKLTGKPTWA